MVPTRLRGDQALGNRILLLLLYILLLLVNKYKHCNKYQFYFFCSSAACKLAAAPSTTTAGGGGLPSSTLVANTGSRALIRNAGAAAFKNSVMFVEIPYKVKVLPKSRFLQHIPRVATDGKYLARLHVVMIVQTPTAGMAGDGALVYHSLAVVLTCRLQVIELE